MEEKNIILKVEDISKQYRLGLIGTGTISHDLNRLIARIRGKEDPFLKVSESNDRSSKGNSKYVWALKDINFEVNRGEVLGIIGKNGAGKSTLLKILSKVTGPTTGKVKSKGRIASLLEVGTGFHPEMTGKENIYLNGAILGMTKKEIASKLDEIVSFSGCERYIDTPVKRYSSGMKVRLAFAVAAHLEPDILVVDEVLAVGDAEFQKKAIGKMKDISKENSRTVLFVSHDMSAVKTICDRAILLEDGKVAMNDDTPKVIDYYLKAFNTQKIMTDSNKLSLEKSTVTYDNKSSELTVDFLLKKEDQRYNEGVFLDFAVLNDNEQFVVHHIDKKKEKIQIDESLQKKFRVKNLDLKPGKYSVTLYIYNQEEKVILWIESCATFVYDLKDKPEELSYLNSLRSVTVPQIESIDE